MKMRILIADDEELERRALRYVVSRIGEYEIEILEAANGRQAVEALRSGCIDLVLLDIRMPGMDGLEAAKEIRSVSPQTAIVFVTAFDNFDYAREALRLGVDEYLLKPADRETVQSTVQNSLARLVSERSAVVTREKTGKEREEAVALLERELRESMERNTLNCGRFEALLNFKGVHGGARFLAAVKIFPRTEAPAAPIMRAHLRQCAEIIEARFHTEGWFIMTAVTGDRIHVIGVVPPELPSDPAGNLVRDWETAVADVRNALGHRILIGVVPWYPADGTIRFSQATDALALAGRKKPVIVLMPSGNEPAPDHPVKGDRGAMIVAKATDFIRAHMAEDLTLADAASAADCSPFYLSHLFKLYTGGTFIQAVMRLRMNAAKALLRSGKYSVKETAAIVGFRDRSYFSRIFRRIERRSPAEFRASPVSEPEE